MSDQFYEKRFREMLKLTQDLQLQELDPLSEPNKKRVVPPTEWFKFYTHIYISYLEVFRTIENCYENSTHPQKRVFMKDMLVQIMQRFLEIKRDLVSFNVATPIVNSEFLNLEETLMELRLQPSALEVKVPKFYSREPTRQTLERNALISSLIKEYGNPMFEREVLVVRDNEELTPIEAAKIIGKMERGRQGMEVGLSKKEELLEVFKKQQRQKILAEKGDKDDFNETDEAIIVIQKYLRGFQSRKEIQKTRLEEDRFFGMRKDISGSVEVASMLQEIKTQTEQAKSIRVDQLIQRDRKSVV